jgi:hypothetical protein
MDKEINLLIKQFNILKLSSSFDNHWICEDCFKLVTGIGNLQKQVQQIQERINRTVFTLKNIVRISHSENGK